MKRLYAMGFLLTNDRMISNSWDEDRTWKLYHVDNYSVFQDGSLQSTIWKGLSGTLLLIGHAYDPFSMQWKEEEILKELMKCLEKNEKPLFWEIINYLTGVFVLLFLQGKKVYVIGDASGMQTVYYAQKEGKVYVSSHTELIGEQLGLKWDPYISRLVDYRFFPLLGNSLPGNLTAYKEVRRLVPNHYTVLEPFKITRSKRFYTPSDRKLSVEEAACEVADILHRNLELIVKKWDHPAISMTGGCDSRTTLAAANGLYNRFTYFSYISNEAEQVDARAAHMLCKELGLPHTIYQIPARDEELDGIDEAREVLFCNCGKLSPNNPNDVRKRVYFAENHDFDIEVKSWASEIGRAYYSKRFHGRTEFGDKPTPRKCTTLYKFFLNNRKLVWETDRVFKEYLKNYFKQDSEKPLAWQEQFFWEFRVPSWNGPVITGEHRYSFDITIPYNNRRLLEALLSVSIEDRIHDKVYSSIRDLMNPAVDATGISATNMHHTEIRARIENLYYILHSKILV